MKPAIMGDSTPIPKPPNEIHLTPAVLTMDECSPTVTYRGIPMAKVIIDPAKQKLYHILPIVPDVPAWPATGSLTVTIEGTPAHRLGDLRLSTEETVILDNGLPDSYGDISRADIYIG